MAFPDWYTKHQKDIAAALKKGRTAPQEQAVSCSFVRAKDGEFLVCAHVTPAKESAQVKEARNAGGKVISDGRLYAGPDGPTFEVATGDLTIKVKFSVAALAVLGSPLSVTVIGPPTPQTGQTPPTVTQGDDIATVRAALSKLVPTVQQVVKNHPEKKNDLLQPLTRCQQYIKDGQAAEAKAVLVEVAKLVKSLAGAPGGGGQETPETENEEPPSQTPPPPSPSPEAPPKADIAAVRAALAKLVPTVQQVVKNHPEKKNDLLQPLTRCQQYIKDGQAAEAKAVLVEVARLVKSLAVAPGGDGQSSQTTPKETGDGPIAQKKPDAPDDKGVEQETPETESSEHDEFADLYNGLLETIPGDLRRLREVNPTAADKVQKVVDGAAGYAAKGNYQQAFTYLNRAAEALAKATGSARKEEAAETIPAGTVEAMKKALSEAQSKWVQAVTAARGRLKPVLAVLKDEFASTAVGVSNIVESYEKELLEELKAGEAKADQDGLAAAIRTTREKVQALRTETDGDKVFTYLEQNGVPVKTAFAAAFDEVDRLLVA